eukprot:CAMPEP_0204154082 /NCGR_PEP_ID=MMETSP0361-20130328/28416_1 /ASSEMBLY_ACC=CAM_ASM_000343 /TAXON_ID=268821 /ORGANISM="Scrippsiella Hangoei, Strain SHTV-5" /LENGTH=46 /DNA_ID= /DNA_START= /DNA_END= /DNA_ORIENTATION=
MSSTARAQLVALYKPGLNMFQANVCSDNGLPVQKRADDDVVPQIDR